MSNMIEHEDIRQTLLLDISQAENLECRRLAVETYSIWVDAAVKYELNVLPDSDCAISEDEVNCMYIATQ